LFLLLLQKRVLKGGEEMVWEIIWNLWITIMGLWKEILIGYLAIGFILALVALIGIHGWPKLKAKGAREIPFIFPVFWAVLFFYGPIFIGGIVYALLEKAFDWYMTTDVSFPTFRVG